MQLLGFLQFIVGRRTMEIETLIATDYERCVFRYLE